MRLASCSVGDRRFAAVVDGDAVLPLDGVEELGAATPFERIAELPMTGERLALDEVHLRPVVPNPKRVICLGLNYHAHVTETKRELPEYPVLFTKFASSLVGARDAIVVPPESEQVDYEAELALVIGQTVRRCLPERALEAVAGYTVANDVTVRDFQYKTHQWLQGKAWDRTTPLGPWLVPTQELGDAGGLGITLALNGRELQSSSTARLIFDVPAIVAHVSTFTTLDPGDVILTGTPGGVGYRRDPQVFLRPGDRVRVEIERVGAIENAVVADTA